MRHSRWLHRSTARVPARRALSCVIAILLAGAGACASSGPVPPAAPGPAITAAAAAADSAVLAGLRYERDSQYAEARDAYERALAIGPPTAVADHVRVRLELVRRAELEAAVRRAVAAEAGRGAGAANAPPNTIGVLPFLVSGGDAGLRPLSRALAELLTTDLAQVERLTVLERLELQLLLDEQKLDVAGAADPATAARAGRLLGAGRLVQGQVIGSAVDLRLQALVVPAGTGAVSAGTQLREQGALADVVDLEKQLALGVFDALAVQLTPAERERVLERPTSNVAALLAFGFGLESEDAGRWRAAESRFVEALQADPAFELAREHLERVRRYAAADMDELERLALLDLGIDEPQWLRARRRWAAVERMVPNPEARDPLWEFLGTEGFDRSGVVSVIIKRPGGR